MRQTQDRRDRFLAKYLANWDDFQIESFFGSRLHSFYRAEMILCEMEVEHTAILLAPLIKFIFSDLRAIFNLNYIGNESVDIVQALLCLLTSCVLEVMVDAICISIEQNVDGIPLRSILKHISIFNSERKTANFLVMGNYLAAITLFLLSFVVYHDGVSCPFHWVEDPNDRVVWSVCSTEDSGCSALRNSYSVLQCRCDLVSCNADDSTRHDFSMG